MNLEINRLVLKIIIGLIFSIVSIAMLYLASNILKYVMTGADRHHMIYKYSDIDKHFQPRYEWDLSDSLCKKKPDSILLDKIVDDYFNAIYSLNMSQKMNTNLGIQDYFEKKTYTQLNEYLKENKRLENHIDGTSLEHHLSLHYFSNDAQIVQFTDTNVSEYNRIYHQEKPIYDQYTSSDYDVIMKFEEGKWQIQQFNQLQTTPIKEQKNIPKASTIFSHSTDSSIVVDNAEFFIQGINYYPQKTPWSRFWKQYDEKIIEKDLTLIHETGFNTLRIFVPYHHYEDKAFFEYLHPKLKHFLDECSRREIQVIITLFDFYGDYTTQQWTVANRYLDQIVTPLVGHEAILAWDVKNEPDLDYKNFSKEEINSWLQYIIHQMRSIDTNHMVTIGWSSFKAAEELVDQVDILTPHYYLSPTQFESSYYTLLKQADHKPIAIGEYGSHSYNSIYFPDSKTKQDQASYYLELTQNFQKVGLKNSLAWTLYDFTYIPDEVVGKLPWRKQIQKNFGLIDKNGNVKPAFQYIAPNYKSWIKKKDNSSTIEINHLYITFASIFLICILMFLFRNKIVLPTI